MVVELVVAAAVEVNVVDGREYCQDSRDLYVSYDQEKGHRGHSHDASHYDLSFRNFSFHRAAIELEFCIFPHV